MKSQNRETLSEYARLLMHNYLDLVWEIAAVETLLNPDEQDLTELDSMKKESKLVGEKLEAELGTAEYLHFLQCAIRLFQEQQGVEEIISSFKKP